MKLTGVVVVKRIQITSCVELTYMCVHVCIAHMCNTHIHVQSCMYNGLL